MYSSLYNIVSRQVNVEGLAESYFRSDLKVPQGQCVGAHVQYKGKDYLQMTGQDYLGLTTDSRVIDAAISATREYGVGALGSAIITGTLDLHLELQQTLARFMNTEDAVIFMTGMLANIGVIPAIMHSPYRAVMRGTGHAKGVIFHDERSHKSLEMACDLCKVHGVEVHSYKHLDTSDLEDKLLQFGRTNNIVISDGIFSMHGTIAPISQIVKVSKDYEQSTGNDVAIYIDSAHDVGVLGENGRGACELHGVEQDVLRMGVLSKAFGTLGGFVVGEKWFTDYAAYCSTHMFSLSLPAAETAATTTAIKIAQEEPERRSTVLRHAEFLRKNLRDNDFTVLGDGTQIVAIVIGNPDRSIKISLELEDRGILCPEIRFPAVPIDGALLRVSPTYAHTQEDLARFLEIFLKVARN